MASYGDLIYVKSRYAEVQFCGSGCTAASSDFSFSMLDMANSDFRDDYAALENTIARYLGLEELEASIYDTQFLNRLAEDYPQYLHIISATDPYDSNNIKDTYNTIILLQQQGHAIRHSVGKKSRLSSTKARIRPLSVLHGSYDEQHASRGGSEIDQGDNVDHEEAVASLPQSTDDIAYGNNSDPDYVDICHRKSKRPRHLSGSRRSRSAATISAPLRNSETPVPAVTPGAASSPELDLIQTPAFSPITAFPDCDTEGNEPEYPNSGLRDLQKESSACSWSGCTVKSTDRLVASWGSDMGRFCHPIPDGFECSCSHRTGTLGDMTRHWQSKRHSEAAFRCKSCKKVYTREDALKRHIRRNDQCARKARRIRLSS